MKINPALKPSLVEWKHVSFDGFQCQVEALKPSLVEWKLIYLIKIVFGN